MNNGKANAVIGAIAFGVMTVLAGKMLLEDPDCRCGCRTLGEHLVKYGVNTIIRGFLG